MYINLLKLRKIRFLIGGSIAVAINIAVVIILVEFLGFRSSFLKGIANIISMEVGTVSSFFIYRIWVWELNSKMQIKQILYQFVTYHLTLGGGIIIRSFVLFPVLDILRFNYVFNISIGIILFTILNYFINSKIFKQ